ncbi:MAG TPA: recombinase family protein, partial [Saprospiraceae bacterium]|nr:recombinase family protein [Saprospiraceae bacterium]
MSGLRFGPVIRVSTEKQEKKGESLATQQKQLEVAIKSLNGTIYKWYAGQEHATPDNERKILDELMMDAQRGKIDAIMIVDISRWSRDNKRCAEDLQILKENNIRFFVQTQEYDLHNEDDYFMISLYSLIGRTQASTQARKSIINKIGRAKKGYPSCGQIPYGRTFNKETKIWGIDEKKQNILIDAAKRYLNGESLRTIASFYKMNLSNLHKLLNKTSGDTWEVHFVSKRFRIDETIPIKVPRLLEQDVIDKIKKRLESNKTFTHGQLKNKYLLSRMIFCDECNYAIFGQACHNGKLYYRHSRDRGCNNFDYIPADIIEGAVIEDIFEMLGDLPRIEQATKAAIPNLKEMDELRREIEQAEKELQKIKKMKDNLIDSVENGELYGDDIKERMGKHRETEALLRSKIDLGKSKLKNIPSEDDIKRKSGILLRLMRNILKRKKHLDEEMTFDDKRKLLQYVFDGKDAHGKRCGVYIRKSDNGRWLYTINGLFYDSTGIARKIDISDMTPKIYADEAEFVYEPLDDNSGPIIDSSEEHDALVAEARANYMQRTLEYNKKQDMRGIDQTNTGLYAFIPDGLLH